MELTVTGVTAAATALQATSVADNDSFDFNELASTQNTAGTSGIGSVGLASAPPPSDSVASDGLGADGLDPTTGLDVAEVDLVPLVGVMPEDPGAVV